MKTKTLLYVAVVCIALLMASAIDALAMTSDNYSMATSAVTGGGGSRQSDNYSLVDAIGQTAAGSSQSDNYILGGGITFAPADEDPPVSSITDPLDGTLMPEGLYNYSIHGTADDGTGSGVSIVEVSTDGGATWWPAYDGSGVGSWSSWTYPWAFTIEGNYCLLSRATDNASNVETPGPCVYVTVDNTAPVSAITSPLNGATVVGNTISVSGTADDGTGTGVAGVQVSINGGGSWYLASGTTSWSYDFNGLSNGAYTIICRAFDNSGRVEVPGPGITVTIANTLGTITLDQDSYFGPGVIGYVEVMDADADVTPGVGNDTVLVTLTSPSDPTGETIIVHEDWTIPGKFFEPFGFETVKILPDDYRVGIARGESMSASYFDDSTPSGTPELVVDAAGWDSGRALWIRNTDDLINDVDYAQVNLFNFCAAPFGNPGARIDTIYLDALDAISTNVTNLENFVFDARAEGLRVECLVGDPSWATPAGMPAAAGAIAAIQAYNDTFYATWGWFDGVHFDVRPQDLPDWSTYMATIWADYKTMLSTSQAAIDVPALVPMALGVDIPDWYDTAYPGVISAAEVQDIVDYTVVKTLSDDSATIIPTTQTEVDYAGSIGKKAYVGLETECGIYLDAQSFCEEGPGAMDVEAGLVENNHSAAASYLGLAVYDYASYSTMVDGITMESLEPNFPDAVTTGDTVIWTAAIVAPEGNYEYDFWRRNTDNSWDNVQPWSAANTWSWTPQPGDEGTYRILCYVRAEGDVDPAASMLVNYDVVSPPTLKKVTADVPSPCMVGQRVEFTATASGGTWHYEYKFWVKEGTTWTVAQDYSPDNTWDWTPTIDDVGSYKIVVNLRSAGSQVTEHAVNNSGNYDIVSARAAIDHVDITPFRRTTVGNQVDMTIYATGGQGSGYEYKIWRKNPSGSWTCVMDYPGSATYSWVPVPGEEGVYKFIYYVRNGGTTYGYDALDYSGQYFVDP